MNSEHSGDEEGSSLAVTARLPRLLERLRDEQNLRCGDMKYHDGYHAALRDVGAANQREMMS